MNRAAGELDTILKRLFLCIKPWKRREQRRMDIHYPVRKGIKEHRCDNSHETGKNDQIRPVRFDGVSHDDWRRRLLPRREHADVVPPDPAFFAGIGGGLIPGIGNEQIRFIMKILIVEDESIFARAVATALQRAGHTPTIAATLADARRHLGPSNPEPPDLVILDMMMPKRSGFLVLEKLKSLGSAVKVIMITANEGSRHKAYAEYLGVIDYIRKPFAMERLLEAVDRGLNPPAQLAFGRSGRIEDVLDDLHEPRRIERREVEDRDLLDVPTLALDVYVSARDVVGRRGARDLYGVQPDGVSAAGGRASHRDCGAAGAPHPGLRALRGAQR